MLPFPNPMCAGARIARFVSSATTAIPTSSSGAAPLTTLGAQAGDIIVYAANFESVAELTPGAGFFYQTASFGGSNRKLHFGFKLLTSGDIASPPVLSETAGGPGIWIAWALYRGAASATFRGVFSVGTASSLSKPGFSRAVDHQGIVIFSATVADSPTISSPSGCVRRVQTPSTPAMLDDKLSGYAGEVFTSTGTTITERGVHAIELLG